MSARQEIIAQEDQNHRLSAPLVPTEETSAVNNFLVAFYALLMPLTRLKDRLRASSVVVVPLVTHRPITRTASVLEGSDNGAPQTTSVFARVATTSQICPQFRGGPQPMSKIASPMFKRLALMGLTTTPALRLV